jgi:uncharacterized secreted protein with C-terminal beta-propeller domain
MKYKIIATLVVLAVLFLLFLLTTPASNRGRSGGSSTPYNNDSQFMHH